MLLEVKCLRDIGWFMACRKKVAVLISFFFFFFFFFFVCHKVDSHSRLLNVCLYVGYILCNHFYLLCESPVVMISVGQT